MIAPLAATDASSMNGAEALVRTLADCGVAFCIANPGTSEMHLVRALDAEPRIRPVPALFEGVCAGAADGIGRMSGVPAATLLHLGPGLANALANLHNARRAGSPALNLVGEHPEAHLTLDPPLASDIDALAGNVSRWVRRCHDAAALARDGAEAFAAAARPAEGPGGRVATLTVGAEAAWGEAPGPAAPLPPPAVKTAAEEDVAAAARALGGGRAALLLANQALAPDALEAAGRVAAGAGCRLLTGPFPARLDGGPGRVAVERLPYFPERALAALEGIEHLVLAGGEAPAAFFGEPGRTGRLVPPGCRTVRLCRDGEDAADALERLAERTGGGEPARRERRDVPRPDDEPGARAMVQAVAAALPEGAVVCADSGPGNAAWEPCQGAAPHSWLSLTGGAIGQGGPCATGAALACPDRPALALLGDGAAAYTVQCLWTQAREELDVATVVFANRRYKILDVEHRRLGLGEPGPAADGLFDIGRPPIDWVAAARSFGVPGARARTGAELRALLESACRTPGPFVIEALC